MNPLPWIGSNLGIPVGGANGTLLTNIVLQGVPLACGTVDYSSLYWNFVGGMRLVWRNTAGTPYAADISSASSAGVLLVETMAGFP